MNKDENEPYSKKIKIEDPDKYIQNLINNLNTITELLNNYEEELELEESELEDHGYGPGISPPPNPRPNFGGKSEEVDDLFWEIKLACVKEKAGYIENCHLDNIKKALTKNPDLINQEATGFKVPLLGEAVCSGGVVITQELLKFNPDLFKINGFGETPLNRGMKLTRTNKSSNIFNTCVEVLRAHQKAGTIDTSVFNHIIGEDEDCNQLMNDIITIKRSP